MGNALAINTEIERRFLVDGRGDKPWRNGVDIRQITQYYLDSSYIEFQDSAINYRGISLVSISSAEFQILAKAGHWVSRIRIQNDVVILKKFPSDEFSLTNNIQYKANMSIYPMQSSKIDKPTNFEDYVLFARCCFKSGQADIFVFGVPPFSNF